jgi:hypothetical protein
VQLRSLLVLTIFAMLLGVSLPVRDYNPLNVYTVQNPRRRVVLIETSQMRTLCTLIWMESCLLVYIFVSFYSGVVWYIFVDMYFL